MRMHGINPIIKLKSKICNANLPGYVTKYDWTLYLQKVELLN